MVKTNSQQLIIVIDHQDPKEALKLLQTGIIEAMQDSYLDRKEGNEIDQNLQQSHYILLEILKATLLHLRE